MSTLKRAILTFVISLQGTLCLPRSSRSQSSPDPETVRHSSHAVIWILVSTPRWPSSEFDFEKLFPSCLGEWFFLTLKLRLGNRYLTKRTLFGLSQFNTYFTCEYRRNYQISQENVQINISCKLSIIIKNEAKYPLIPIAQTRGKRKEMHLYGLAQRGIQESVSSNGFNPGGRSIRELWERVVKDRS
jgi:hypothetical protein